MLEDNVSGESLLFGKWLLNCWCCSLLGAEAEQVLDILAQSDGEHFASPLEARGVIFDLLGFTFKKNILTIYKPRRV